MTGNRNNMSCEEFSSRMAELVAAGEDLFAHPHVKKCPLHRALLEDLEEIARAAKQMFPEVDPPDTLWNNIEARMAHEHLPGSLISDPWPGCRVVVAAHAIEGYNPKASPPPHSPFRFADDSALWLTIIGDHRTFAPKGERR